MSATQPSSLGKYEIRGTLGRGAMGTVYDGWDPMIDRRVAIKTVRLPDAEDEEAVEGLARFKREAQAAGRLTHPNIVGVFDYGETDEVAYIVMEFVEGRSLKEVLGAEERMLLSDIVALMEDVLAGLTYSHSRGVVHRDIKPANIMLTKAGQAKIADFGIARIEASSMTQAGTVMGTPAYMSPEQFMGQVVDQRTDIYSCGVMLYQLLTGDRPFDGSMTAIMHKALTTTPPRPSELAVTSPASLDGVVARAMARRPEDRYASAADFAQALRRAPEEAEAPAGDETIVGMPVQPVPLPSVAPPFAAAPVAAPAAKRRNKLPMLAGGGVATVAIAGAALWFLLPGATPPPPAPSQLASVATPATPPPPPPAASLAQPPVPEPAAPPVRQASVTPAAPAAPPLVRPAPSALQPAPSPASPSVQPAVTATARVPAAPPSPPVPAAVQVLPATVTPASSPPQPAQAPASPPVQQAIQPAAPERVVATPASPPVPPAVAIPASVAPEPVRPASRPPAAVLAALAGTLPTLRCTLTHAAVGADGAVVLTGVSGKGRSEEDLQHAASAADPGAVTAGIQTFDGPYCPALDALRPFADPAGRNPLDLVQAGGKAALRDNEVIALHVTMPGFAGYLQVAYLQHDATVSPLVPGPGYPAQTFLAHEEIDLGKPRSDFEGWHVGPPFGTDMIVAVASTAPLFSRALPDSQPIASYVSALQTAIEALRRRGGNAAVSALVLETRPNP
jgi:predicted Ser/Thr protein kinase